MKGLVLVGIIGLSIGLSSGVSANNQTNNRAYTAPIILADARSLVFSPRNHRWYAYSNGRLVRSGVASGGASYCSDIRRSCRTPTGSYRVIRKGGPGCRSSRYPLGGGGAPMPYCIHFSKNYAVHGSHDVPSNRHASHGCVRVYTQDAAWLNRSFLRIGDSVRVTSY